MVRCVYPNKADDDGDTPLHIAARFGQVGIVRLLIDNPSASWQTLPNEPNAAGETALHLVMQATINREEITEILLKYFASPNSQTNAGYTPLHCVAAYKGSAALVNLLLDKGANTFMKDNTGATAFDLASRETNGNPTIAPVLQQAMQAAAETASAYGISLSPPKVHAYQASSQPNPPDPDSVAYTPTQSRRASNSRVHFH